jgi:hypothetical protein
LQPPNTPKRVQDDDNDEEDHENEFKRQRKMRALAKPRVMEGEVVQRPQKPQHKEPIETLVTEKPITDEERERILKLVENEEVEVCVLSFMEIFSFGNVELSVGSIQVIRVRVLTLVLVSCLETDLPGVLCGKAHCDAAKSIVQLNIWTLTNALL